MKTNHKHWAVLTASTLGLTALVSATTLGDEKYTYDGSGNIIEKSINGQVTKMSYDASNKVTSISSPSKGNEQVNYDAAGRPVSYKDASGQVTRELSYGYADKVLKADNNGSKAEFFYNAEGQLVGKAVEGTTTSYSWDGNVLAAQGEEAFTNEAHISGGVPVLSGDQELIVSDYLGNTLSQGISQLNSSAYGEGLEQGRFTGKAFVEELGGYIFHHRNYSSETNRWTVGDPIGFPDGKNNKSYVNGDPTVSLDPLGLKTFVRLISPILPAPTSWNGPSVTNLIAGGKVKTYPKITRGATSYSIFNPKPAATGRSVSVGCGIVGASPSSWSVSLGGTYGAGSVSVNYTFGTSGTASSSGSVSPGSPFTSGDSWEGDGGLVKMILSSETYEQFYSHNGHGNYSPVGAPQATGHTSTQPNSWLSSSVIGEFREYRSE